jgi:transferase hexapeptide repeat
MKYVKSILKTLYLIFTRISFPSVYQTRATAAPIQFRTIFFQKILGVNRAAYWPMHYTSRVSGVQNIYVGIGSAPGLSFGCYVQGIGKIKIGNYVLIAPNVGIISANHDLYDHRNHSSNSSVIIGDYSWIGMNSVILPNVVLGDFTVVAAGAVVTKSFAEGYCVIGGNPAKVIEYLEKDKCIRYKNEYEYYGYYSKKEFEKKFKSKIILN